MNEIIQTGIESDQLANGMRFAQLVAKSTLAPTSFKGKPEDILIAIMMGHEVGLKPMQALQNIAVINGRPSLWGDAMLALAQSHPQYEYIKEEDDGIQATCIIKRKNSPEHTVTFSMDDAKNAGLLNKKNREGKEINGPWKQYPKRMRQMRARGFALRDQFADALKGFNSAEEMKDLESTLAQPKDISPPPPKTAPPIIEGEVLPEVEKASVQAIETLSQLIVLKNVTADVVHKVLEKAEVTELEDLNSDQVAKWVEHLKGK